MNELTLNLAFGFADGIGGSEQRMLEVVAELAGRGARVTSIAPGSTESVLNREMARSGAEVATYRTPVELIQIVRRSHALMTWAFGARAAMPLLVSRSMPRWRGGQLWIAKNGLEATKSRPAVAIERLLAPRADLLVANSQAAAEVAITQTGVQARRVRVLPSALPPEWGSQPARVPRDLVRIAMVGNSRPEKQHSLGLDLFARLGDPQSTLDIYTNDGSDLRRDVQSLDETVASRVTIHEGVRITASIVEGVDVLLHPSSSESLPRVALEARSQGVWVVGFDVGSLGELCNARVPWGDESGLVRALAAASGEVREGHQPPDAQPPRVADYVDSLLALLGSDDRGLRQGDEQREV